MIKRFKKSKLYKNKKLSKIDDIDVDKILVSKKESYGKKRSSKYFIGYNDDDVIRLLCIKFPKMIGYVRCFDSNKIMTFNVTDKKLLKVSNLMNKEFDSEPGYADNNKYMKRKIKIYGDNVNKRFSC